MGLPEQSNLCAHLHPSSCTPLRFVTKLPPFMMPYSCQLQGDHSFCFDRSFAVTAHFTPTAPFGNLPSSWPETANDSHPTLAHNQDQQLPTMSPMMHPALKFASDTMSGQHQPITYTKTTGQKAIGIVWN